MNSTVSKRPLPQMKYLVTGAPVYTMDSSHGVVQAMVIENGLVLAVGARKTLRNDYPGARELDLDGGAIIPAFNDSHAHLLLLGQDLTRCDLGNCTTRDQVYRALKQWHQRNGSSEWIMGWNFDGAKYKQTRALNRKDLDQVSTRQPVVVSDQTKHALVANSEAMRQAGISDTTKAPDKGIIERDLSGKPTGVFREMAAMEMIESALPDPGQEGICKALKAAMDYLEQKGILAATEAFAGNWYSLEGKTKAYNTLLVEGAPLRITLIPEFNSAEQAGWFEPGSIRALGLHKDLRISHVKLMADGAISARTAALTSPYENCDSLGHLALDREELDLRVLKAHQAGWGTATHAIGDRAVQITLEAVEKARAISPNPGLFHRIEHAILLDEKLIPRLKAAQIMIAAQPQLLLEMGDNHYSALGARCFTEKPYASLIRAGVGLGFGSDLPVVSGDPIPGWRAAVVRQTKSGLLIGPNQGLDPLTALACYTRGSALIGNDPDLGTLVPGNQARFVVLNHPPELIDKADIKVIGVSSKLLKG